MPATQEGSGRLLPSIVRINSESDIDEVTTNEQATSLPVILNNYGEGELKEKWWMRQRNRFNIRALKLNKGIHGIRRFHLTKGFHHYKVCTVLEYYNFTCVTHVGKGILQNTSPSTSIEYTSTIDILEDCSSSNIFRPWKIRHNSIFSQPCHTARSTDELYQSSTSTIVSKPSLFGQSQAEVCPSNKGIQLLDLGPIQNNNTAIPVHATSPVRKKPHRLYNKIPSKPPNYEFFGFLNSPEKLNSFFVINGEVENQLVQSTPNVGNMPKQMNRDVVPAAVAVDDSTVTEQSPAIKSVTFDGSLLDDQDSQINIDTAHKSTVSITKQIDVNVAVDENTTSSQGQRSINMQINITLPTEINATSVRREIMPQPTKLKQPKPTPSQETPVIVNAAQVDNTTLNTLLKESRVQLPELPADNKKKKQPHKGIVIKHLIPCAPRQPIDWDNYPDMMINGTKFGEYVYRGLQALAAAVLSRIIEKLYRQLGKGKAKDLAKLLRSLKGMQWYIQVL